MARIDIQKLFIVDAMMEIDVFTPASTSSVRAFMAVVIAVLVAFVVGVRVAYRGEGARGRQVARRAAVGAAVWVAVTSTAVGTGALAAMPLGGSHRWAESSRRCRAGLSSDFRSFACRSNSSSTAGQRRGRFRTR